MSGTPAATASSFPAGSQVRVWCTVPTRVAFGATASGDNTLLAANTRLEHTVVGSAGSVSFLAESGSGTCYAAANTHTKISVVTKDAVPLLNPDCDPTSADAEAALQCRSMRAATFDITGHLRQIQAGRPRWLILPRDAGDLCCYPGEGLACPKPLKSCQ